MAGPSGAGAVAHYLKLTRSPSRSAHREIRAARRREDAKANHGHYDAVEFDCAYLCTSCGRLVEPTRGDPMRSLDRGSDRPCPSCGAEGLADLRHTPTTEALCELEVSELGPSGWQRLGQVLGSVGLVGVMGVVTWLIFSNSHDFLDGLADFGFALGPIGLIATVALGSMMRGATRVRRTRPRRWQLPDGTWARRSRVRRTQRVRGRVEAGSDELLRAPLSGRPCVAYELAVRDDADAHARLGTWRLVEQASVGWRVGEVVVGRGRALLERAREHRWSGLIMSQDPATRRTLRVRGLSEGETVHVYETIVEPGERCSLVVESDGLVRVG